MNAAGKPGRVLSLAMLAGLLLTIVLVAPAPPALAGSGCGSAAPGRTVTLKFMDGNDQYVGVPAGVRAADIQVRGGHGGQNSTTAKGGHGGVVETRVPVTSGTCLDVIVGGYGNSNNEGYQQGGGKGKQQGPGYDGADGGASSGILFLSGGGQLIAGGGGGGGGNGAGAGGNGGVGGNGAGGDGPGTPGGSQGGNATGIPYNFYENLGGRGGYFDDGHGGGGSSTAFPFDLFSGAGGAGGGGNKGGFGGGVWYGTQYSNAEKSVGGGGGGGGDSAVTVPGAKYSQYLVDDGKCPVGGGSDNCDGLVSITWVETPAKVEPYAGAGQSATITSAFRSPLEARVLAASGDPVPRTTVTFKLAPDGASGTFVSPGQPTTVTATADNRGIAKTPAIKANATSGPWTARASVAKVTTQAGYPMSNRPAETSTAVYATPEPSKSGEGVTVTAVVGATPSSAAPPVGSVEFEIDGSAVGSPVPVSPDGIAIAQPVPLGAGSHQVSARFSPSADFSTSAGSTTHRVQPGSSLVKVKTAPDPSTEGQSVNITAEVSAISPAIGSPVGTVRFSVDGVDTGPAIPLSGGSADTDFTFATEGQHVVRVVYSGDEDFSGGNGVTVQSVGDEATSTTLSTSDESPAYGGPLTFTADVTGPVPPTGEVSFTASSGQDGEFELCTGVTLQSGQAACTVDPPIDAGEYEIFAGFEPDQLGMKASEDKLAQIVNEAPIAIGVEAEPNPNQFGAPFGLNAAVTPVPAVLGDVSGSVAFSVDGSSTGDPVDLVDGNAALGDGSTPPVSAGSHPVSAAFSGDRNYRSAESSTVLTTDPVDTTLVLKSTRNPVPFRKKSVFKARVKADEPIPGQPEGAIQFWVDGEDRGGPVDVSGGRAAKALSLLRPGPHDVRAYFSGEPNLLPSEGRMRQRVDSPPPGPDGIIPCAKKRLVLTAAYRLRNSIRFEGVARYAARGMRVRIRARGHVISETTVRPDGTFWAAARAPRDRYPESTSFRALAGGHSSWPRRLGQSVIIRKRTPRGTVRRGKDPRIRFRIRKGSAQTVRVSRQIGCRKADLKPFVKTSSSRKGMVSVGLPRPKKGRPYAIYRLHTDGAKVSSPIVVRPAR